jgi:S1-C subfamily serine protease
LLDSAGKLIGINAQIFSRSGGSEGIGFAIPVKIVKHIVDELIRTGHVTRPELGFNGIGLGAPLLNALKIPSENGVMITQIARGSAAARAGLKAANRQALFGFQRIPMGGDVVFQLDSTPVTSMRDILDYLSDKKIGDSLVIHYYRNTSKKTATVKLGSSRSGGEAL